MPTEAKEWFGHDDAGVYIPRLLREGWRLLDLVRPQLHVEQALFEKPLSDGSVLRKLLVNSAPAQERHQVLDVSSGAELVPAHDWEWADVFKREILYAKAGRLYRAREHPGSEFISKEVSDLRGAKFSQVVPPYRGANAAG